MQGGADEGGRSAGRCLNAGGRGGRGDAVCGRDLDRRARCGRVGGPSSIVTIMSPSPSSACVHCALRHRFVSRRGHALAGHVCALAGAPPGLVALFPLGAMPRRACRCRWLICTLVDITIVTVVVCIVIVSPRRLICLVRSDWQRACRIAGGPPALWGPLHASGRGLACWHPVFVPLIVEFISACCDFSVTLCILTWR